LTGNRRRGSQLNCSPDLEREYGADGFPGSAVSASLDTYTDQITGSGADDIGTAGMLPERDPELTEERIG
jgi:hypothetical protein